ncbi:hypothetical protein KC887_04990 [Candidatus Kaiserbacteria bacterium]|nr:hypothetical protein [Candidatus Kaiserbacteria bacterium]
MRYDLIGALEHSLSSLFYTVMNFLPELIIAIVIVVLGWMIGGFLGGLVTKVFKQFHLDDALDKAGVDELSKKAGYSFQPAQFIGELVKWFIILAFLIVALDVLHLTEVTIFMRTVVLNYLPAVFSAVLILFAGVIAAGFAKVAMVGLVRSSNTTRNPELFGRLTYYMVIAFTVMAVLNQLKIADDLVRILFMGIVFALSLAAGLAFGLGGKEAAARYLNKVTGGGGGQHS